MSEQSKAKVYVGTMEFPFRRMIMFHMASPDVEALHAMAERLGVRKWFQADKWHPHYDICKSKKAQAIALGAVEVNDRELIRLCYPEWNAMMDEVRAKRKASDS